MSGGQSDAGRGAKLERDALRGRRVLLLLGQSPFDPTSGAAQSMRQIATLLASEGASVRTLSTTGCEGDPGAQPAELMAAAGANFSKVTGGLGAPNLNQPGEWIEAECAGVAFALLVTAPERRHGWEGDWGGRFDARLTAWVADWRPELVLTFGGDPSDERRRHRLRAAGARVVFALHNGYYAAGGAGGIPGEVDAFLAPSDFLAARYAQAWGRRPMVLPPPIDPELIVAARSEPVAVVFCNPEPAKGSALVARLADRLGRERPDVPLFIVGGRAGAEEFVRLGCALGLDLRRYSNLLHVPPMARVAELWGACRVVLVPSIVEEAAGRVVIEAMANGAVPLVSDRGGLPEMAGSGGEIIPWPEAVTLQNPLAIPADCVDAWWTALRPLLDDEAEFARRSAVARRQAERFLPPTTGPLYRAWFGGLLRG